MAADPTIQKPPHPETQDNMNATLEEHEELKAIDASEETPVYDEHWHQVSRQVVRKLDMTVMPMIWVLYLFNYLDRNSIA
jgi:hypothetical protein